MVRTLRLRFELQYDSAGFAACRRRAVQSSPTEPWRILSTRALARVAGEKHNANDFLAWGVHSTIFNRRR